MAEGQTDEPQTVYDLVGGEPFFARLVDYFYQGVADDPILGPMYPPDLAEARRSLREFLVQYWGGPDDYSQRKGHPRLRMRHAPFVIDESARQAWMLHMGNALDRADPHPIIKTAMLDYFTMAASHMVNARGDDRSVPDKNLP